MIHLVTDLLDPSLGSEFQIAHKALQALMRHTDREVHLWTCLRDGNEARIRDWLQRQGCGARVRLSCVPMRRATAQGHHRHRGHLALDLLDLYRAARAGIQPGDRVWKCGQSNFAFYLLFLLVCRADALGPISGFERPPFKPITHMPWATRLYYVAYSALIVAAGAAFRALRRRRPGMRMLAATETDRAALATPGRPLPPLVGEVSLGEIVAAPGVRKSGTGKDLGTDFGADPQAGAESDASPSVIWAGALIHRKNPLLALEVLARVLARDVGVQALMVGRGPLEASVRGRWAQLPEAVRARLRIEPPRPRDEFVRGLAGSRVLLVTSLREVNSVLVYEAMAQGLAVVSTAVSGMQRSVGACGELFSPHGADVAERAAAAVGRALEQGPRADPVAWLRAERDREDRELHGLVQEWAR